MLLRPYLVRHTLAGLACLGLFGGSVVGLPAQNASSLDTLLRSASEPGVPEKAGKVLFALRLPGNPPIVDGRLDDPAWALADSVTGLVQWDPDNGQPMTDPAVIRVLYDDRYLYVGIRLHDSDPGGIRAGLGRRDAPPPSDAIYVGFDPRHDHLTGYVFGVNPSAVQTDMFFFDDTNSDMDYDAVWDAETAVDEWGWTAELRIPFSQMRFPVPSDGEAVVWGFDVRREIHRKNESGQWVGRPRGARGQVSRWGHLVFDSGLTAPRRTELVPYVAGRTERPAVGDGRGGLAVGADFRYGLGSAATLSATVNPDFAQVEADPAVLNLSVFETFFPEKRPFFLEDANTFIPPYGLLRLFHSRRIGRRPGSAYAPGIQPGDVVLDRPAETTILGAAKVTGKTGGTTFGALTALTQAEYARVRTGADDPEEAGSLELDRLIEPLTSYSAARVQRDVLGGSSNVGAIATAVVRDGAPDAFTGGADFKLRWDRNRWQWNGHVVASHAPDPEAWRSGEREPAALMATGFAAVTNLFFNAKHVSFGAHFDHFGRDFRVTDLGFAHPLPDRNAANVFASLMQPDPGRVFRSVDAFLGVGQLWTGDGTVFGRDINGGVNYRLLNFWSGHVGGGVSARVLDPFETRGGPPVVSPGSWSVFTNLNSDPRRRWRIGGWASGQRGDEGGSGTSVDGWLEFQPSPRFQARIGLGLSRNDDPAQWLANLDATGNGEIDHVFARLRSDVMNVAARGTFSLSRDVTLQAFLQPFVAVGDYTDLKRLARPGSFDFEPLPDHALGYDPDFNIKSLRGTTVLRWEYGPGSALFLVWNVAGRDPARPGVFSPRRDFIDALRVDADHLFMIKATYWLNL
jgi:hypothetical protein